MLEKARRKLLCMAAFICIIRKYSILTPEEKL